MPETSSICSPKPKHSAGNGSSVSIRRMDADAKIRFWSKVDKSNLNGCWIWIGGRNEQGYGIFYPEHSHPVRAHRVSFFIKNLELNDDLQVCHTCDNPPCVNPDHLFQGTAKENAADRDRKGRRIPPRGNQCWQAKLTPESIIQIREQYEKKKTTHRALAKQFGVTKYSITRLLSGDSWKHI